MHIMNICGKFHWNLSTKYRDIASRVIGVNGQRTDDSKTQYVRCLLLAEVQKYITSYAQADSESPMEM